MGWTGTWTCETDAYKAMSEEFDRYMREDHMTVHARSMVPAKGRGYRYVGYAVVSYEPGSMGFGAVGGKRFALVMLLDYSAKDREVYYKDMDETVLPCECGMSARMVGMLDPTDNESAKQWRANCLAASKAAAREHRIRAALRRAPEGTPVRWVVSVDCDALPAKGTEVEFRTARYRAGRSVRTGLRYGGKVYRTAGLPMAELEVLA